mmetsp:Transcript_14589/g.17364  ORF Transcript_14589/g.17364 Transcript_14589/m.17364 type:complete len:83 (+) Transcript_14589:542-790(+)
MRDGRSYHLQQHILLMPPPLRASRGGFLKSNSNRRLYNFDSNLSLLSLSPPSTEASTRSASFCTSLSGMQLKSIGICTISSR